jgi:dephospho-CoA kinase
MTRVIGLTGNIASGKSTVAALLAAKGATVLDADELAREVVAPGTPGLEAIRTRWPLVIARDGSLDRGALRAIVFADPAARAALDAIVHPHVNSLFQRGVEDARRRGDRFVVYDVPLLFEANLTDVVDVTVLVDAPVSERRARLMRDRALSAAEADAMIASQMPAAQKRERADFVIENDADLRTLRTRVNALWESLARGQSVG